MTAAPAGFFLWGYGSGADIDSAYPGEECWSTAGAVLISATGVTISSSKRPSPVNFAVW